MMPWPSGDEFRLGLPPAECLLGFPEREMSAFDAVDGSSTGRWCQRPGAVKHPQFGGVRMKVGCFGARMPR